MLTPLDIEAAFLDAAAKQRGLRIPRLVADGRCHRCDAKGEGKHGRGDDVCVMRKPQRDGLIKNPKKSN